MSIHFLFLFSMTVFIASIIPGPSMLLALTHGMQFGARRTMASALGNVAVTMVQAFISIVGLGTVLMASETVFLVIKWAGAGYLIYMGITMLLSSGQGFAVQAAHDSSSKLIPLRKMFFQASMVTAGNPKAIVFFTAVFPQFINPEAGYALQCSILLSLMALIAFVCFMIYALGGQKIVSVFSMASVGRLIKQVIGTRINGSRIGLATSHK